MKTIKTKQAPQAIGPYSQAKIVNGLLITSGRFHWILKQARWLVQRLKNKPISTEKYSRDFNRSW